MSSAQIRLTEPQVFLVGALEYERARARQRRATAREAAAANRPPSGETPPPSPGPSSRRNSPERERSVFHISASRAGSRSRPGSRAASPAARGRLGQISGNGTNNEEFIPPNSRGRSASRSRGASVPRGRAESESLSVGRSGSLVRDSEHQVNGNSTPATETLSRLDEPPPALLRGLLTVTLSKPTRVKEILVRFKGSGKTDWPEGIGPRRLDVVEENILINVTHKFFSASDSTTARRAASVGPSSSNRDESRGRAPARRAASVAPGRDASHGRSYPNNSLFPNGLDNPPLSHSASDSTHATTGLSRISSNDSHETSVPPRSSSVPPVRPGEAAPAYEAVPSAPPSPLHLPQTVEEMSSSDSLDLNSPSSSSLRPNPSAASYQLRRSPTPTRSPLGMSTSMLPQSSSATSLNNAQTNGMPRLARSSTRASQNSEASTSSSQTSHSNEAHHSSSSIISSSSASENGRGRATTRDESRESAGSDPAGDLSIVANGVARHSRSSLHSRPSPSPSGTTSPRSPSTPRLPSALKTSKSSSRSGSRARFSLSGISEVLRGKSSSRARAQAEEEENRPPLPTSRRDSSPDVSTSRPSSIKGSGGGRSQSRGRKTALKVLREALTTGHAHLNEQENGGGGGASNEDHSSEVSTGDGWKEFKAGTYVYPISIPVPGILPPTLSCEFGSVSYNLKATVVRAGALTTNLTAHSEVMLVAMPGEDDTEESESIVVERFWETQMKYHVALSGKSFPIGGQIPLTIRLSPLAKVKVFRVSAQLEQKTSYFASVHSGRKLTRHETPRKVMLIRVDHKDPDEQMLPILSEDQNALLDHPLREWFINATSSDDTTPSLLDPDGPWHLEHDLQLPDCSSKINFSTHHEKSNIAISHVLKIMIRVERGDDEFLDSKGKRKRWDIVVETPVHLLSCRCAQNLLPAYTASSATLSAGPSGSSSGSSSIITRAIRTATGTSTPHEHTCGAPQPSTSGLRSTGIGATVHRAALSNHHPTPVASLEQNLLFARLISGETTPNGETPPTYQEISQGDVREVDGNGERGRSRGRSSTIVVVDDQEVESGRGRSSSTRRG